MFRDASRARFIVGAGASLRLEIQLRQGNLLDCAADCFALALFNGIDPSGAAAAVDSEMHGAVQRMLGHRMFSANVGEITILPNGRHLLRARAVAFVGMGTPASFKPETMEAVGTSLLRMMISTSMNEIAMVPFGVSIGHWTEESFGFLIQGFITALREQPGNRFRSVAICDRSPERIAEVRQWLRGIATSRLCEDVELSIDEGTLVERQRDRGATVLQQRAYLFLTQKPGAVATDTADLRTHAALILPRPTTAAAAWLPQPASAAGIDTLLATLDDASRKMESIRDFGTRLATEGLAADVRQSIAELDDTHLAIVHGEFDSPLPWEAIHVDGFAPALAGGISHRYLIPNRSIAKWSNTRAKGAPLKILVVADPTEDLPGAMQEVEMLRQLAKSHPQVFAITKELVRTEATLAAVVAALSAGAIDILHYAGHAFFNSDNRTDSGLLLHGREVLTGRAIMPLGKLPALIFFNACESGNVRGEEAADNLRLHEQVEEQSGLAEALLRSGVGNFVGTYWKVKDRAAVRFAETFYAALAGRQTLNAAVLGGRRALRDANMPDWANYVFYGDPDFNLFGAESTDG